MTDETTCSECGGDKPHPRDGGMEICGDCFRDKMGEEGSDEDKGDERESIDVDKPTPLGDALEKVEMTFEAEIDPYGGKENSLEDTHVLADAADAVYDRADTHGAEDCFSTIADLWSDYLDTDVDEGDVCNLMILLKVARNKEGVYTDDNWADIAGYAESGSRVSEGQSDEK